MPDLTVTITEEQRQASLLALAVLSLQRPGWDIMLRELAQCFRGNSAEMYDEFRRLNADRYGPDK